MRELIDSKIEWIGDMPNDWKTIKIKYTSWLKGRIGWQGLTASEYTDEGPFLITGTDFENGIIDWSKCAHISKERFDEDPDIHVKEGDLLITKDGTVGKVAIAKNCPDEVSLNSGVLLIRNVGNYRYYDKYLYYVLLSDEFWRWYTLSQTGQSTIKHLYQAQFYSFEFAYPSYGEQKVIANFLDSECAHIDAVIEQTHASIEEYKKLKQAVITRAVTKGIRPDRAMKDSGIEWIGEIPEEWGILRIKWLLNERNERSENGEEEPLSMSQKYGLIPTKEMDIVPNMASSFVGAKLCYKNDLVFNKLKAHLGVFAVSQYDGLVSPDYAVYYANGNANLKYLEYLFKTPQYIGEFKKKSTGVGAGLTRLYTAGLYSIPCALPSLSEQVAIVDYLNGKIQEVNSLIEAKEQLLSEIEKYKKSLIYEYVTGKKEAPL